MIYTQTAKSVSLALALTMLMSCGSDSDADSIRDAMLESTNMPEGLATCFSERADTELDENGRAFLIASMRSDQDRINELRGEMTLAELTQASMFMASAGSDCGLEAHFSGDAN